MNPILFSLYQNSTEIKKISALAGFEHGKLLFREFPDQETYLQLQSSVTQKDLLFWDSLDRPNSKILPLLLAAETARDNGAKRVGLCAPYLCYMRQDKQFNPGEGLTAKYFAKILSEHFDYLVTIDPHLHRYPSLNKIYTIPTVVLHATTLIAQWIKLHIKKPLLIGPDSESEQWVSQVAQIANAPFVILNKTRLGDKEVEISPLQIKQYLQHTPILIDDIISTANTMIQTVKQLKKITQSPPVCIGVHAILAENAYESLHNAGASQIITCNTIAHQSNQIDVSGLLISGIKSCLERYLD